MIKITIGQVIDSVEVMVTTDQTVEEVFRANGKGSLLAGNRKIQVHSDNAASKFVNASSTLESLGVKEGDCIFVTENYKSANK